MDETEFLQRLLQSEAGSPEAAALARELVEEARYPACLAVRRYLASADAGDRMKAKNVLADLRELALVTLAETEPMQELGDELWTLRIITDAMVDFRLHAASVLKDLLSSRRTVPPGPEGVPNQAPPGARVCDLAFILLHRMLHVECSADAFFATPPDDRDNRIENFWVTRVFRSTFEAET